MERYQKYYKAIASYTPEAKKDEEGNSEEGEQKDDKKLSFHAGDVFFVLSEDSNDWVYCKCLDSGKNGFVPVNYLEEVLPVFGRGIREQTRDAATDGLSFISYYCSYIKR